MQILFITVYLLFSVFVAWAGRRTYAGFVVVLILSIVLTPLFVAFLLLLFRQRLKKKPIKQVK